MRTLPLCLTVTASLAVTLCFAADPQPAPDAKSAPAATSAPAGRTQSPAGQKQAAAQHTATPKPNCIKSTGSRIPVKPGDCRNVPGHTYSQEELRNTGETNTAEALRRLDPSFH